MKSILLCVLFLSIAFASYSTNVTAIRSAYSINDTTPKQICFTVEEVQQNISYKQALEADILVYKSDVAILTKQIASLHRELQLTEQADSLNTEKIQLLQDQIKLAADTRADLNKKVANLERDLRRAKRGRFWVAVAGAVSTISLGLLYLTK